ncbi:MAG: TatD family hydrolase [Clostridia bacterium]|nr:TatD family hydrolase [Clostridia bacterium]
MTVSFDTHAHISDKRFDEDRYGLTERLPEEGVALVCDVACDLRDVSVTLDLIDRFSFVYGAVGMHPHTASFMDNAMMDRLKAWLELPKIRALGEIGLDYYYDLSPREVQREWFDKQLSLAAELKKPVVLHVRDAIGASLDILKAHKDELIDNGGIMHCYSGSAESAKAFLDLGLMLGFGGSLTFKNNRRGVETASVVPLDRVVFETDCPYLAPVPHRGERNDPTLMRYAIEMFAQIRGVSFEDAAKLGFENGKRVFGIE